MLTITNAHLQPLSQQTVETAIFHAAMEQVEEYSSVQRVEKLLHIDVENPADVQTVDHIPHRLEGLMRISSWSKTIREIIKISFKDRLRTLRRLSSLLGLLRLSLVGRYLAIPLFSVWAVVAEERHHNSLGACV